MPTGTLRRLGRRRSPHRLADRAPPLHIVLHRGDGLFDLMLVEVLHQSQHLNELAASGIAHPRFHQPAKPMNAFGEPPAVERRGLIERLALVFQ
jgi:hypothetical protein